MLDTLAEFSIKYFNITKLIVSALFFSCQKLLQEILFVIIFAVLIIFAFWQKARGSVFLYHLGRARGR